MRRAGVALLAATAAALQLTRSADLAQARTETAAGYEKCETLQHVNLCELMYHIHCTYVNVRQIQIIFRQNFETV